jgi:acetyl-CoA C-acetyltransferase
MSKASIIGAYNTAFGSFVSKNKETKEVTDLKTIYELMNEAGQGALKDAGVDAGQIDGIWVGSCSPSLFTNQEHLAPNAVEVDPVKLRFKAATRAKTPAPPLPWLSQRHLRRGGGTMQIRPGHRGRKDEPARH